MGRPQTFDERSALLRAMQLFQERGFVNTSMQQLVDQTGVCRASLYKTFGNKKALFEKALEAYRRESNEQLAVLLEGKGSVRERLRQFLHTHLTALVVSDQPGCLVVRSTTEVTDQDSGIRETLQANEAASIQVFERLFQEAQQRGEWNKSIPLTTQALLVLTFLQGLSLSGLIQEDTTALEGVIDAFLEQLF